VGLTTHRERTGCNRILHTYWRGTDALERTNQRKMEMTFGSRDVRSLYRTSSLQTIANKLAKYTLVSVAVQDVREKDSRKQLYTRLCKRDRKSLSRSKFFVHQGVTSVVKGVEFIRDRMSYVTLRGRRFDIIVLYVYAP
jgi:hypothetical protein